jgi:signal transduction histidine kinase
MAEITTALLVLAREQRVGGAPPAAVAKVVQDAVEKHRHLLEGKATEVKLEIGADPHLAADRALLLIVVGNLIRNAFQHTDWCGDIRLTTKAAHRRHENGIAEAELPHIFSVATGGERRGGHRSLSPNASAIAGWDIAVMEAAAGADRSGWASG